MLLLLLKHIIRTLQSASVKVQDQKRQLQEVFSLPFIKYATPWSLQGSEPATFVSPEQPNTPKRKLTVFISESVSLCRSVVTREVLRRSKAWSTKQNRYSDAFQFKQESHPCNKQPAWKGGITFFPSLRNDRLVEGWLLFPLLSSPCSCNLRFQLSPPWLSAAWEGEDRRSRGRSWLS